MPKHGAATQSEVAYAETRSCYTVQGRICRNTELLHSSRMQMLKHGAVTQFRIVDAETQRRPPEPTMLKHKPLQLAVKADTVKSTIHVAETARELRY
jgi:hypothetical protein